MFKISSKRSLDVYEELFNKALTLSKEQYDADYKMLDSDMKKDAFEEAYHYKQLFNNHLNYTVTKTLDYPLWPKVQMAVEIFSHFLNGSLKQHIRKHERAVQLGNIQLHGFNPHQIHRAVDILIDLEYFEKIMQYKQADKNTLELDSKDFESTLTMDDGLRVLTLMGQKQFVYNVRHNRYSTPKTHKDVFDMINSELFIPDKNILKRKAIFQVGSDEITLFDLVKEHKYKRVKTQDILIGF